MQSTAMLSPLLLRRKQAEDFNRWLQIRLELAFRREFGYTPTQYVARLRALRGGPDDQNTDKNGGILMDVKIIEKPAFKVAGYGIKTNIAEGKYTKDIAAFWDSFDIEGWECKLYDQLQPPKHGEVGLSVPDSRDASSLTYVLGVIVENFDHVTEDMVTVEVPTATYAVFTTPPVDTSKAAGPEGMDRDFPQAIRETWKYIFEQWFRDSGYEYDQGKMDFEYYDERCHFRPDTVMEIYIPIKRK
ncbi:MAG: AraC family transcriptional regulator [Firmicutes bacterium]|nr:AraC family transcriptional regulator [Bacillota bacterium]